MTTHVALLRGVNLAGHKTVAMADLRALFERLGFGDPRTALQSGNVVFGSDSRSPARLEATLEEALLKRLGVRTEFFVRTAKEWSGVVASNPFPAEAERDPGRFVVAFLKDAPGPKAVKALQAAIVGREVARAVGRQAYIVYPDGQGTSRLTTSVIDKALATRCTARNWNTVMRLAALAGA
jgi:uncharacterized protein (DUF1697 family)